MKFTCECCKAEYEIEIAVNAIAIPEPKKNPVKKVVVEVKTYGEFKKIRLKDSEYNVLVEEFGLELVEKAVAEMDAWQAAKGKAYKDYRAALAGWIRRSIDKNPYLKEKMPSAAKEVKERRQTKWEDD